MARLQEIDPLSIFSNDLQVVALRSDPHFSIPDALVLLIAVWMQLEYLEELSTPDAVGTRRRGGGIVVLEQRKRVGVEAREARYVGSSAGRRHDC